MGSKQDQTQNDERLVAGRKKTDWLLESLFNALDGLLVVIDRERRVVLSNWRGYDFIPEEDRRSGGHCYRLFKGLAKPCDDCPPMDTFRDGRLRVYHEVNPIDDSHKEIRVSPILDEEGRISHVVEYVADITERRRVETERSRLAAILESTSDMVSIATSDGRLNYMNRAGKSLIGWADDEKPTDKYIADIHPEWVRRLIFEKGIPAATIQGTWEGQTAVLAADGREIPTSQVIMAHKSPDGEIEYLSTIIRDLTEIKKYEKKLQLIRFALDHAPDSVYLIDENGRFHYSNLAACQKLGYTAQELAGMTVFDIDPDITGDKRADLWEELRSDRGPIRIQTRHRAKDGDIYPVEVTGNYMEFDGNGFNLVFARDITQRLLYEETLRQREAHLRALIDSSTDNIFSMDTRRVITECNPAFLQKFGYMREEVIGRSVSFIHPNEISFHRFGKEVYPIVQKEGAWRGEWVYMNRDEEVFPTETTVSVIRDSKEIVKGYVVIIRDISERNLMEAQLRHSQKMEALGSLASGIAHDFNNILQAVSGYVQLIKSKIDRARPFREHLNSIDAAADRASSLVRQLLTFSRKLEPTLKPVDLNKEVDQAIRMLSRTIPKMIAIEFHPAEDLALVNADAAQIEQVLLNLGANARDAMPDGGRLIFETKNVTLDREYVKGHLEAEPGRYVLCTVTDTGQGMDRETLEHIFEPFYTTKGMDRGTGLGLSMVYGIIKGHGGSVYCYSEPGKGTVFKIYLPAPAGEEASHAAEAPDEDMTPGGNETILLVDDDHELLSIAREILEEYGYAILEASNGEEALMIYRDRADDIDLVLLDFGMPGIGGHKTLETLLEINPLVQVIIVSGYSLSGRIMETLNAGAKAYIGKPYRLDAMLKTVRRVLDRE